MMPDDLWKAAFIGNVEIRSLVSYIASPTAQVALPAVEVGGMVLEYVVRSNRLSRKGDRSLGSSRRIE